MFQRITIKVSLFLVCLFLFGCPGENKSNSTNLVNTAPSAVWNKISPEERQAIARAGMGPGTSGFSRPVNLTKYVNSFGDPPQEVCEDCHIDTGKAAIRFSSKSVSLSKNLSPKEKVLFDNYTKKGGNPRAFKQLMCFFKSNHNESFAAGHGGRVKIKNNCKMALNDFTKPSDRARMYILDRCTGEVVSMQSAHGSGKCKGRDRDGKCIKREVGHGVPSKLGNGNESNLSPSGFFVMGGTHHGKKSWSPGVKMHGLQVGVNHNSYSRSIVMHKVPSCTGGVACYRTNGCLGLPQGGQYNLAVNNLKGDTQGGALVYNYSAREASKGDAYCGDSLWKNASVR